MIEDNVPLLQIECITITIDKTILEALHICPLAHIVSFVVEKIFAIPGLGREFVTTITNRDYTTILGVTIFYSTLLILCNLIVDIMYVIIDPRIKLENVEA